MNFRNVMVALLIGLVAGWLASFIVGGGGSILKYLVWGILGSFVGSYALRFSGISLGLRNEVARDIVTATIGAVLVVIIARLIA
jgi:uncharacterized membrane protein YeaQ/YmgE (transglycosylase-associated protein family)